MSCQINNKRYFLIQVKLHNNKRKIEQAQRLCDYLEKKGHHFILNYIADNYGREFLIEVDEEKFRFEYEF